MDNEKEFYKQLVYLFAFLALWLFSESIVDFLVSL